MCGRFFPSCLVEHTLRYDGRHNLLPRLFFSVFLHGDVYVVVFLYFTLYSPAFLSKYCSRLFHLLHLLLFRCASGTCVTARRSEENGRWSEGVPADLGRAVSPHDVQEEDSESKCVVGRHGKFTSVMWRLLKEMGPVRPFKGCQHYLNVKLGEHSYKLLRGLSIQMVLFVLDERARWCADTAMMARFALSLSVDSGACVFVLPNVTPSAAYKRAEIGH